MTTEKEKIQEHRQPAKDLQNSILDAVIKFWDQTGIVVTNVDIDWHYDSITNVDIKCKY
jgi:hypothetical protein